MQNFTLTDIEQRIVRKARACRTKGYLDEFAVSRTTSADDLDTLWVDLETTQYIGRITCHATGECDLEILDMEYQEQVLWQQLVVPHPDHTVERQERMLVPDLFALDLLLDGYFARLARLV